MPAPSTTIWGTEVTGSKTTRKGKIGINFETVSTEPDLFTVKIQVWFWSRYQIEDVNNEFYYTGAATEAVDYKGSVNINHTSGSSWSTSNQTLLGEYTQPLFRNMWDYDADFAAKLSGIDVLGSAMTVTASVTVPACPKYTVTYNLDGGSGTFNSQTKYHISSLTLNSSTPTKMGYEFQHWISSSGVTYTPGATYSTNADTTLTAVWEANTCTVTYNANGGTGAPKPDTKYFGIDLPLSSTVPTREGYNFLGWATSSASTTVAYVPGGTYSDNQGITLYAVWSKAYNPPRIYNVSVKRCDSAGNLADDGTYALISCEWDSDKSVTAIKVDWTPTGTTAWTDPVTIAASGTTGTASQVVGSGSLDPEVTYTVRITVIDGGGSDNVTKSLFSQKFTIDFVHDNNTNSTGVAFGKTAELVDTVDFAFDAKFNKPVYGKALGMDIVTRIPENSDLNEYLDPGCYAIYMSDDATTIANCPLSVAGRFEVWSSTGNGVQPAAYTYIRQCYHPFDLKYGVVERDIMRFEDGDWTYGDWVHTKPSSVTLFTSAGNSGTINLSELITDFAYLEIYYNDNNGRMGGFTKIASPTNGKIVDLSLIEASTNTSTMIRRTAYTMSGSTLIPNTSTAGYTRLTNGSSAEHLSPTTNFILITKVVGYYE